MDHKIEAALFLLFFATLMAPLATEIAPNIKIYLFDLPLAAMYAVMFMRFCTRRLRFQFDRFDFLFLIFYAWLVVCAVLGKDFSNSLEWLLYWLRAYLIIFYMRHHVGALISSRLFFFAVGFCLLLEPGLAILQTVTQSSVGVVQQYFGTLKTHHSGWNYEGGVVTRAQGTFVHTNFFGNWLVMLMPFLQAHLMNERHKLRRPYVAWWLVCFIALVLTLSRANWMAFAIGFVVVLFAESRYRTTSTRRRRWAAYLMTPVAILAVAYSLFTAELDFVFEVALARAGRIFEDKSSDIRSDLLDGALIVLKDHPYTGVGAGNSSQVIHSSNSFIPDHFRATVHNIYLVMATENGYFGALLFVLVILWPLRKILRALRTAGAAVNYHDSANAIGFVAAFASLYFAMLWYLGMFHESEFPLIMTLIGGSMGTSAAILRKYRVAPARPIVAGRMKRAVA